ncbi:MAG: 3-oxo-5-alpha-steroid 4-dehydrogenase [Spirochaetales bacterium]|nr:MAG: 3-oxo-5-alpha-steroid 4-dehydrogenase [Spirochaetales bacterium]
MFIYSLPLDRIFRTALIIQFALSVPTFLALLFIRAPYGKFSREGWGARMNSLLAWVIMELPAVVFPVLMALLFRDTIGFGWIFLAIWEFHYLYRTIWFPLRMSHNSRKSFPVSMVSMALFFHIINCLVNFVFLFYLRPVTTPFWFTDIRFLLGLAVFLSGFALHFDSDRRIQKQKTGPGVYVIPKGGFFRWVAGPNYLGEIIQWFGWALLTWSVAGLAFAVFTFANVFPRALAGYKWYLSEFEDCPENWKAVIPGII